MPWTKTGRTVQEPACTRRFGEWWASRHEIQRVKIRLVWFQYICGMVQEHIDKRRPNELKVVIEDNLTSHFSLEFGELCEQHNIRMSFLPPNSTHLLQPLDVGVFGPPKLAKKQVITAWKMGDGKHMTTIPKRCLPKLLLQLELAREEKWQRLAIISFRACGIYPLNAHHLISKIMHLTADRLNFPQFTYIPHIYT